MTSTESRRVTETTYATPSHIAGLPFEHRVTVVTDYKDHRDGESPADFDALPEAERAAWGIWLDDMHEQEVRRAEMHVVGDEEQVVFARMQYAEWCDQPSALREALDEIEAARAGA